MRNGRSSSPGTSSASRIRTSRRRTATSTTSSSRMRRVRGWSPRYALSRGSAMSIPSANTATSRCRAKGEDQMYGTIARLKVRKDRIREFLALGKEWDDRERKRALGYIGGEILWEDSEEGRACM